MDLMQFVKPRPERLAFLRRALENDFSRADFDPDGLGITRDLTAAAEGHRYAPPKRYPTRGAHPRVYFNAGQIPGILAAMQVQENQYAVRALWEQANADGDGILGPRRTGVGKRGEHNYDYQMLNNIQSKAFAYVLTGYDCFGYEAIYMIENYIRTLDIYWMYSDQCREFGLVMFTAACVYDWCYPLLSEEDKFRITAGVEHRLCRGEVEGKANIGPSSWGFKMEIGFPPYKQGALTGHGSENQLMRDYLAFSIAVFDELPEWYEFIGGRFYEQYVEPRNYYYTAGTFPQGTGGYNAGRFTSDLYSAVLLRAAVGEIPYREEDMRRVVYGLIAPVTDVESREVFPVGDFYAGGLLRIGVVPLISSYLFDDPTARAIAQGKGEFSSFDAGLDASTPATPLIYSSRGTKTASEPFADFPRINYNGGWYGQTVARRSFAKDSPISLMKVQCRSTANHDHNAAGTFQIYYKGPLTGDMGNYTGVAYGMTHCVRFMRSTVAHNGLLIYNPALRESEARYDASGRIQNGDAYYYCGAQRRDFGEPRSLEQWTSALYRTGEMLGHAEGYLPSGEGDYAYIAGDITPAYHAESVELVRRSMLTVFGRGDGAPMTLFVSDRIDTPDPDFRKTFLLQVPTVEAPVIDAAHKQVTLTNGKGKLRLTSLSGCDEIVGIGGSDDSVEDPAYRRRNYVVNGEQLHFYPQNPGVTPADGDTWGRVELSTQGERQTVMTTVLQVTDEGVDAEEPSLVSVGDVLEGARVGRMLVLFATGREPLSSAFSLSLDSDTELYLLGLAAGEWRVGEESPTHSVSPESGMLKLALDAGEYCFDIQRKGESHQ